MVINHRRLIKQHFTRSRIIIAVCALAGVFLSINLAKETVNRRQINEKISSYEAEALKLERENREIRSFIDSWKTGWQLEREARLKLGLQKAGERAVLILRANEEPAAGQTIKSNSEIVGGLVVAGRETNQSNFKKWWQYFFNN